METAQRRLAVTNPARTLTFGTVAERTAAGVSD
jgi:hypothetical protein